jgi:hypothetical protein
MEVYVLTHNYCDYHNGGRSSDIYIFRTLEGALAEKKSLKNEWDEYGDDYYIGIETHTLSPNDLMLTI